MSASFMKPALTYLSICHLTKGSAFLQSLLAKTPNTFNTCKIRTNTEQINMEVNAIGVLGTHLRSPRLMIIMRVRGLSISKKMLFVLIKKGNFQLECGDSFTGDTNFPLIFHSLTNFSSFRKCIYIKPALLDVSRAEWNSLRGRWRQF